jgi:dTDP-4-dehydrorhamnose 3,5-epimerase
MKVQRLGVADVMLIEPTRHGDARGFFSETWSRRALAQHGLDIDFVQDNHAFSAQPGVLRGLHFQRAPSAQGKLVRVARGAILDVAVDIRQGSPTYGQHVAEMLSAANWRQLWVPRGFAHGYLTLEPDTEVLYKTDDYYDRDADGGIAWDDPALGIDWGHAAPILSDKDRTAKRLADIPPPFPTGSW